WKPVKGMRDTLAHRAHTKVVFGDPADGVLFQVYDDRTFTKPQILDTRLLRAPGTVVVDFGLYSAAIMGELLAFLDDLGVALGDGLGITLAAEPDSFHVGDFTHLLDPMNRLLRSLEAPAVE